MAASVFYWFVLWVILFSVVECVYGASVWFEADGRHEVLKRISRRG